MAHYAYAVAVMGAGEAQHTPHFVYQHRILQIVFCHELRPQGVARHDNGFGDFAVFGPDMGSRCISHNERVSVQR